MMFFVYTHILNQHHNFVNSFIYKFPIICIFVQIDTAKFVEDKQKKSQTKRLRLRKHSGRGRRIRTLGTWFWRPLLYQLSYTPISRFEGVSIQCQQTRLYTNPPRLSTPSCHFAIGFLLFLFRGSPSRKKLRCRCLPHLPPSYNEPSANRRFLSWMNTDSAAGAPACSCYSLAYPARAISPAASMAALAGGLKTPCGSSSRHRACPPPAAAMPPPGRP